MTAAPFLRDLVVLLAASLPIVFLFQKIRVPALVGFLITGILIGPSATGLIHSPEAVEVLAEFGVVLLLFTIGLEFSLAQVTRMGRLLVGCGGLQVAATFATGVAVARVIGLGVSESVVVGFLLALSSTAIVLKLLSDRGETDTPHGHVALAVLLFQDLCVVPMMLLLPVLSQPQQISLSAVVTTLGTALAAIGAIVYAARFLLPALLRQVLSLRNRELFVATVVLFCFGTAWLTAQFGLSLAIGAFVAGLVISESEYSHQVTAEILPFRDLFNSVFFMSMGMLLDVEFFLRNPELVAAVVVLIVILKAAVATASVLPFRRSARTAIIVGLMLAQIGEFSFVLAAEATSLGALAERTFQVILNASIFTMLASPFLIAAAPAFTARLLRLGEPHPSPAHSAEPGGHVLIIGYGLNGRNLARVLRETGVPYRILELNAEVVRTAADTGTPIIFGDATRPAVLRHAGAETAAIVVVAISDAAATRRIVSLVREMNRNAALIVRTRYMSEIEDLYRMGADEVIPEEFETSVEIFARVLRRMHVPRNVIAMQVDLIRNEGYAMLRGLRLPRQHLDDLRAVLAASTTETYLVRSGSPAVGKTIRDIHLRRLTGVTIIAVVRQGKPFTNPAPDFRIEADDVLVMLGDHAELAEAMRLLNPPEEPAVST